MRNRILTISISIFSILIISLSYFSIYGIKTDNFNNLINNKIENYNSKLKLQIDEVYIKLNLKEVAININTKNANLIAEGNPIKISNIDVNLNLIKFLKRESSIKNIKIKSSSNLIKDIASFLNIIDYDQTRYIFYNQIQKGLLKFELDAKFDNLTQDVLSYSIIGSVNNAKLNIPGYENFEDVNFDFRAQDTIIKISNLNLNFQKVDFSSKKLLIKEEKSGAYYFEGDFENTKALINPNIIFKLLNIKQDYLSDKNVMFESKNLFSFKLNENKKIKNIIIDTALNFEEIYFNNKHHNIIFLKNGTINSKFENKKIIADLTTNFGFIDNLDLDNNFENNNLKLYLKSENNKKIEINGNFSNKKTLLNPKIFLNFLDLDPKLLSEKKVNIQTDNKFKFEVNNGKIENYLINSDINLDKLETNKKIQDTVYFKNIKAKLTFKDKLFQANLNSNYSFLNKNYNNKLDNNIINIKLDKNNSKISDLKIFFQTKNNKIDTKEFKKYFYHKKLDRLIKDQLINLNSDFTINLSIDKTFNIRSLLVKSDLNFDKLNINYKSSRLKKYFRNYNDKLDIKNPQILFEYSNDQIKLQLDGKYVLQDKEDNIYIKFKGNKNNFELYSLLNLDDSILNINEIQYSKKKNIPSKLELLINNSKAGLNFEKISFNEGKNYIFVNNLFISDDIKIKSVDKVDVNFFNKNRILNNFIIKKNLNNYKLIGNQIDGEKIVEEILKGDNSKKISNFFENINTSILFKLDKIYLEKNEYLKKFEGEFDLKNNEIILAKAEGVLDKQKKFSYFYRTTVNNEKITNMVIEKPKPFINNYKFIKGFEEGELKLNSTKIDNTSRSNLKITNFKVKEVPVLAKILTLASLQGIADLLTGEGIRFNQLEIDFKTKNNLTEIDEMYALGPAISILLEGYIEKNRITSLRGTLVPATTINKTIAKIPLLGNILVGTKSGEGVFGVSFKIKGSPNDLKSTVNPIKTLTPRFITRTLENLKGN